MEDVLFWGLVLAGVIVGFLVAMLFASERELKAKNRRLAELESTPSSGVEFNETVAQDKNSTAELERQIEDLTERNIRLEEENLELKETLEQHRERDEHLVATQERLIQIEMQSADFQRQNEELKDSNGDLRVKLQESEENARQLEIARSQLVELQNQHQRAQEKIAQLRTEAEALKLNVAEEAKKTPALEEMQNRLAHMEIESRETQSDNNRLRTEAPELETGPAASRENIQELENQKDTLQEPDSQKEEINVLTDAAAIPGEKPDTLPGAQDSDTDARAIISLAASGQMSMGNAYAWKAGARIAVGVVLALVLAGTLASGFWRRSQKESPTTEMASAPVATEPSEAVQVEAAKDDAGNASEIQTAQREDKRDGLAPVEKEASRQAAEPAEEKTSRATPATATKSSRQIAASKPKPETLASLSSKSSNRSAAAGEKQRRSLAKKPAAEKSGLSWGKYEVIHPTKVYSEPNEQSETVASIDVGIKVNVVAVRDNWLEIRSKFGRPPGFIKKESATRLAAQ